jgi:hypothetical protein
MRDRPASHRRAPRGPFWNKFILASFKKARLWVIAARVIAARLIAESRAIAEILARGE